MLTVKYGTCIPVQTLELESVGVGSERDRNIWVRDYKTFFILNTFEHEIYHANIHVYKMPPVLMVFLLQRDENEINPAYEY